VPALGHVLAGLRDGLEPEHPSEGGIDDALPEELVVGVGLLVVRPLVPLQPLLAGPVIAVGYDRALMNFSWILFR
jgi:hypothetical protein